MIPRSGSRVAKALVLVLSLAACAGQHREAAVGARGGIRREVQQLETRPWHVSAGWHADDYSSTAYPEVSWAVVEELHAGMSAARAKELLGDLQSYHHPVNAIAFARNPGDGWRYEVALKLSADGKTIEDLSFKHVEREPTGDFDFEEPRDGR